MLSNTIKIEERGNTRFVAHRGMSGLERENTASAFVGAGNRTYYGIETDIRMSNDGKYICCHDGSTRRVADVDISIADTTFDKLREIRLSDKDNISDRGDLILPTPYEYMKICKKYGKIAFPELKLDYTIEQIKDIMKIFEDGEYLDNTCFIAFEINNLDLVKKLRPEQRCQYLIHDWNDDLPKMLSQRNMGLDIYNGSLTKERVEALHENGVDVNCYTVDDPERASELISWGVDYITTNILE